MNKEIDKKIEDLKQAAETSGVDIVEFLEQAKQKILKSPDGENKESIPPTPAPEQDNTLDEYNQVWEKVLLARHADRPTALEYVDKISEQYIELRGDRYAGDDSALVGGICTIRGIHFTFIANQKGSNMKENMQRNYGMAHPEGYRKALRLVKQAERFKRPVISFIDTSGAYPGLASEERGIGEAIAKNLMEFSALETPIICIIIGEGGSGGALGIGIGDRIFMLENAIYSVISPEGFASILLRDSKRMKEAALLMKMTAQDVLNFGFIDGIIQEPRGGAHVDVDLMTANIQDAILHAYSELKDKDLHQLVEQRSKKIIQWTRTAETATENKNFLQKVKKFFVD